MGTNKKQTALNWLEDQIFDRPVRPLFVSISVTELSQLLNQAKQMEREQMINFYGQGVADTSGEITDATKDANQYYEETYGK